MAQDKHWLNIIECPRIEVIISHTSTLKPASPILLISVHNTSIHSLSHLNQKFAVSLLFPKFQLLSYHLDTFLLAKSRMQGHKCSLPSPSLRNVFAASSLEDLDLCFFRTKCRLAYHFKAINSPSSVFLRCNTIQCLHSIHLDCSTSPL